MMKNWTKQEWGHREQHIRGARKEGRGGREEKEEGYVMEDLKRKLRIQPLEVK